MVLGRCEFSWVGYTSHLAGDDTSPRGSNGEAEASTLVILGLCKIFMTSGVSRVQ